VHRQVAVRRRVRKRRKELRKEGGKQEKKRNKTLRPKGLQLHPRAVLVTV